MAGRNSLLVMFLALTACGCAAVSEERIAGLEAAVGELQSQEVRLTILEDAVAGILAGHGASAANGEASDAEAAYKPPKTPQAEAAKPAPRETPAALRNASARPATSAPARPAKKSSAQVERQYKAALSTLESGNPVSAMALFSEFLREHPGHALAPNAGYWLGECYYSNKQFDSAVIAFKDVVAQYPDHDKAAASMLKAGYSYAQLGDTPNARFYLEALVRDYPASAPATLARARLASL